MSVEKRGHHGGTVTVIEIESSRVIINPREQEILQLRASGLTRKEIANNFQISKKAVAKHCSSIFSKLGVGSLTEAIVVGAEKKIIDLDKAIGGLDIDRASNLSDTQKQLMEKVVEKKGCLEEVASALFLERRSLEYYTSNIVLVLGIEKGKGKKGKNNFYRAVFLFMVAKRQGRI